MKIYIAIVGRTCSGKETFGHMLQNELPEGKQVSSHRFSDALNETLDLYGIPRSRPNQQELSTFLREKFGQHVIACPVRTRMEKDTAYIVYLDGVRRPADIEMLRSFKPNFLIALTAPPEMRHQRLKKRKDRPGDEHKTWEEFQEEQKAEPESMIDELAKGADICIDNSGTKEELRWRVRQFIKEKLNPLG
jgi:dephospho-CoA kinase